MHRRHRRALINFLILSTVLFGVWMLLSGKLETKFVLIGLASALVISFICAPLLLVKNQKTHKRYFALGMNWFKFLFYSLWVVKEIFKSTIDVTKEIIKPNIDYVPRIIYFSMPFENPMADIVLSNSIILTPGTITIDVTEDGIFEVHALNKSSADDLMTGKMAKKVADLFGETCEFKPIPEYEMLNIPKEVG